MVRRCVQLVVVLLFTGMQSMYFQTHTTSYFRIKYEKPIPTRDASKIGSMLESSYAKYKKIFDVSLSGRVDVTIYNSAQRMARESKVPLFDDGVFRNGKIFMAAPAMMADEEKMRSLIARITSGVVLYDLKSCPHWLAECYSVYCGGDLSRFGMPNRLNVVSFADLAEDVSHAESLAEFREMYAKLAVTASFLVNRYGITKFESVFARFKKGASGEEAFESAFGEKIGVIEKAWVKALASPIRE